MRELVTDIEIATTPEHLFNILVDGRRFSEWNPFIRDVEGDIKEGSRIKISIEPPGAFNMKFKPIIRRVVLNRGYCWLGHLLLPGLFDGEHCFEIVPLNNGNVRFVQRETFRGILIPLLWSTLRRPTEQGFINMNIALKKWAENSISNENVA